jgi:spore cortex biosynthesis protein YabQ
MMFETVGQAGVFLAMVYAGLLVGLMYDGLRLLRRLLLANAWVTALLDLIFWLGAGAVTAVALALRGEGALRLYALAGCASGAVLYLLGISRLLRALGQALARGHRRAMESPRRLARLERQRRQQEARQARRAEAAQKAEAAREAEAARKAEEARARAATKRKRKSAAGGNP